MSLACMRLRRRKVRATGQRHISAFSSSGIIIGVSTKEEAEKVIVHWQGRFICCTKTFFLPKDRTIERPSGWAFFFKGPLLALSVHFPVEKQTLKNKGGVSRRARLRGELPGSDSHCTQSAAAPHLGEVN